MLSKTDQKILMAIYEKGYTKGLFRQHLKGCFTKDLVKWGFNKSRIGESLENLEKLGLIAVDNIRDMAGYDEENEKIINKKRMRAILDLHPELRYPQVGAIFLLSRGTYIAKILKGEPELIVV